MASKGAAALTAEIWALIEKDPEPFGQPATDPALDQWVLLGPAVAAIGDAAPVVTTLPFVGGKIYARITAGAAASSFLLIGVVN